jgi:hypothetical protein
MSYDIFKCNLIIKVYYQTNENDSGNILAFLIFQCFGNGFEFGTFNQLFLSKSSAEWPCSIRLANANHFRL